MTNKAKSAKSSYKEQRKREQERQSRQTKRLIWITVVAVIAIIAVAFIFKPADKKAEFAYDQLPMLGKADAPVKIVEVGDYKCPVCKDFSQQIEPQLKKDYIDTGIVSFYFVNYPFIDVDSHTAAQAGQAVYHQSNDAFWKYYDEIYKNQQNERIIWATPQFLNDFVRKQSLPIDYDLFQKDLESKKYEAEVDEQTKLVQKLKVTGTPTLFINGKKVDDFSYESIKKEIELAQKAGASS